MTHDQAAADIHAANAVPQVRKITVGDLRNALRQGANDFKHEPSHVLVLTVIYPILGFLLFRIIFGYKIFPLLFPLAAGFALVGPLAAIGFYEISRRREQGKDTSGWSVFSVFRSRSAGAIVALGALLLVIYLAWLYTAEALYESQFGGTPPASLGVFFNQIFGTPQGLNLMLIGNAVGLLFAILIFSISVVSFPMLVDRNVSAPFAMATSLRAVTANPFTMAVWALIIAVLLVLGSLPFLLGLVVVLPILGHASWHLYRKVVAS